MPRYTDTPRNTQVQLRLTEADKAELQRLAASEGLSMSVYIRKHLLNERVTVDGPKAKAKAKA